MSDKHDYDDEIDLVPGMAVCIQTVTYAYVGKVKKVNLVEIILEKASAIFDTGDFTDFLRTGEAAVVTPFPQMYVRVGRASVVVNWHWPHALPTVARTER